MKSTRRSTNASDEWSTDPATPLQDLSDAPLAARPFDDVAAEARARGSLESSRFAPGAVLADRYRIVGLLGRGGMGEVYRAQDLKLAVPVSLKFLPRSLDRDPKRLRLLLNEVKVARQISHPNVCRVYDIGEADGLHFITMEYVAGEDLRSFLRRIGRLPYEKAVDFARQLCDGLAAAHDRGVLHRDVKPSNLMIDREGRARILDFGIAVAEKSVQGPEAGMGTPTYMSPEQLTGDEATTQSDIYMLGLVLYELFTGRRPFSAKSRDDLIRRQLEEVPEPPSAKTERIEPAIERVILACLEKDPPCRPVSVAAISDVLGQRQAWTDNATLQTLVLIRPLNQNRARPAEDLLERYRGQRLDAEQDDDLLLFRRPIDAVRFALDCHRALEQTSRADCGRLRVRLGIHLGEVALRPEQVLDGASAGAIEDRARTVLTGLVSLARERQILMTQAVFDLARHSAPEDLAGAGELCWMAHGEYHFGKEGDSIDVCEVGVEGFAPLEAPRSAGEAERIPDRDTIFGWRPAPGLTIPHRPHCLLERRLEEGGFGEVWLARHRTTSEPRAFKFCYDAVRLRALRREIALFRLLKEELGDRPDITRIHDWNFEKSPYFIESQYSPDGNLEDWVEARGGIGRLPLEERLEIVAQVATALAAANSVGVLHKDVKPANVLMTRGPDGKIQTQLTDFGIGAVTEQQRLAAAGITAQGWTEEEGATSSSPTGTRLYMAPELLEGRPATLQADIYALGVMLWQMLVGDFSRALAPGWEREVSDELLRDDVAAAVDGRPERRFASAAQLAERLRTLDQRQAERDRQRAEAERLESARRRARRGRRLLTAAVLALTVFAATMAVMWRQVVRREETTREVSRLLVELFQVSDPEQIGDQLTMREVLDRGARRVERELQGQPVIQARLMHTLGEIYRNLGHYDRAGSLLERSLEIRRELYGDPHPEIATTLSALADVLRLRGRLEEALKIARDALDMRRRLYGDEHVEVAESHEILGRVISDQGDLALAQASLQASLEMRRRLLGDDHLVTAAALARLGDLLAARADYTRAREYYEEALGIHRELLGDDPRVAHILQNLGGALHAMDLYGEAERLYREALELNRRLLGEKHPSVASSLQRLAILFRSAGDYDRSKEHFARSLAIYQDSLGENHPYTIAVVGRLAHLLREKGDNEDAEGLYRQALDGVRRTLGNDHSLAANHMLGLAEVLRQRQAYEEAEVLLRETLVIRRKKLGNEHPLVASTLNSLGMVRMDLGDYKAAEELYRDALDISRRLLGPKHSNVAVVLGNHVKALLAGGEYAEAEKQAREAYGILLESMPEGHWLISNAKAILGACLQHRGRHVEAEELLAAAYRELVEKKGEEAFQTRYAYGQLALLRKVLPENQQPLE